MIGSPYLYSTQQYKEEFNVKIVHTGADRESQRLSESSDTDDFGGESSQNSPSDTDADEPSDTPDGFKDHYEL